MLRLRGITVGLNSEFSVIALVYTQFHPTEAGKKKSKISTHGNHSNLNRDTLNIYSVLNKCHTLPILKKRAEWLK